jgi:tRNA A37 methylthiotransferase MiaB
MTDVIVGYPTETDEHYWGTLEAVKRTQPDSVNISRFWPRPGTKAAELKPLQGEVMKHRSKMITEIFHNISKMNNERWIGWEGEIVIDEKGKESNQWTGRNYCYKPIIVEGDYQLGQKLNVRIVKAKMFDLRAEVV